MTDNIDIKIEGLEELQAAFKRAPQAAEKHSKTALRHSVNLIDKEWKHTIPRGATGGYKSSIYSKIEGSGPNMVGRVGSNITKPYAYPLVVEYGRKAGAKMPPPKALVRWVHLVLKVPTSPLSGIRSAAFNVARAIGKKGIKGKFLLTNAYKKSEPKVIGFFGKALDDIVKEIGK